MSKCVEALLCSVNELLAEHAAYSLEDGELSEFVIREARSLISGFVIEIQVMRGLRGWILDEFGQPILTALRSAASVQSSSHLDERNTSIEPSDAELVSRGETLESACAAVEARGQSRM